MAASEVPKAARIGLPKISPTMIRMIPVTISKKNEVFWISLALSSFFCPLAIENRGAPPLPNILVNAVVRITIGKQRPTAPRATVPISGIRAMYILSTMLYKRFMIWATSIGSAVARMLFKVFPFSKSTRFILCFLKTHLFLFKRCTYSYYQK